MENLSKTVGDNLTALRKAKNLTQQELADELHYSDKSISKWELGYSTPSIDILKEIADFYGVTVDYLIKENSQKDIEEAVAPIEKPSPNKAIILSLSILVVWLIGICVFLSRYFFSNSHALLWPIIMWTVPCSFFVALVTARVLYGRGLWNMIVASVFMWTFVACFAIQYQFFNQISENIWYIMIVCVPLQAILILFGRLKKRN